MTERKPWPLHKRLQFEIGGRWQMLPDKNTTWRKWFFDPYAGKTLTEMKQRARDLIRHLERWQFIAMHLAEGRGVESLPREWQEDLARHIEAYKD